MVEFETLRLINSERYYDKVKKRFSSAAFQNSSGGGISVVSSDCINVSERAVCDHLTHYYPIRITGQPAVFLRLKPHGLTKTAFLEQQTTESGDVCHYNLMGLSNKECRALFLTFAINDFEICAEDGLRFLDFKDIELSLSKV